MAACPGCWRDQPLQRCLPPIDLDLCSQCTGQLAGFLKDGPSSEGGKHALRLVATWRAHDPASRPLLTPGLVEATATAAPPSPNGTHDPTPTPVLAGTTTLTILALQSIAKAIQDGHGPVTIDQYAARALLGYVEALEGTVRLTSVGPRVLVQWRDG